MSDIIKNILLFCWTLMLIVSGIALYDLTEAIMILHPIKYYRTRHMKPCDKCKYCRKSYFYSICESPKFMERMMRIHGVFDEVEFKQCRESRGSKDCTFEEKEEESN